MGKKEDDAYGSAYRLGRKRGVRASGGWLEGDAERRAREAGTREGIRARARDDAKPKPFKIDDWIDHGTGRSPPVRGNPPPLVGDDAPVRGNPPPLVGDDAKKASMTIAAIVVGGGTAWILVALFLMGYSLWDFSARVKERDREERAQRAAEERER